MNKYILDVYLFKYYNQHAQASYVYIPTVLLHLGQSYFLSLHAFDVYGIKHPIILNIKNNRNAHSNV